MPESDTSALVAFITDRIAEDERIALAAGIGRWAVDPGQGGCRIDGDDITIYDEGGHDEDQAEHIVRHDPARILRELPLKRRLLDEHRPRPIVDPNGDERGDWPERVCGICDPRWMGTPDWEQGEGFVPPEPEYCEHLRMLGSIWSDHPDYRTEWGVDHG